MIRVRVPFRTGPTADRNRHEEAGTCHARFRRALIFLTSVQFHIAHLLRPKIFANIPKLFLTAGSPNVKLFLH